MRGALEKVAEISDITTNVGEKSCTFSATAGLDVKTTLDTIVEGGNEHIKNWSLATEKSDDSTTTKSTDGLQAVSINLPGMT